MCKIFISIGSRLAQIAVSVATLNGDTTFGKYWPIAMKFAYSVVAMVYGFKSIEVGFNFIKYILNNAATLWNNQQDFVQPKLFIESSLSTPPIVTPASGMV